MKPLLKPLKTKTQASYERLMLEMMSEMIKQQRQSNRLLKKIAHETDQQQHEHSSPFKKSLQRRQLREQQSILDSNILPSKEQSEMNYQIDRKTQYGLKDQNNKLQNGQPITNIQNTLIRFDDNIKKNINIHNLVLNQLQTSNKTFMKMVQHLTKIQNLSISSQEKSLFKKMSLNQQINSKQISLVSNHQRKQIDQRYYNRLSQIQPHADHRQTKVCIKFSYMLQNSKIYQIQSIKDIKPIISEWLGLAYRATASICWNFLQKKLLNFQETKILFTENIIFNYIELMKDIRQIKYLGDKIQLEKTVTCFVNTQSIAVLAYLCKQYPQTKIQAPNMAIRQEVPQIDQRGQLDYQLVHRSGVKFCYKSNKDYAQEIMLFLNFLIDISDKEYDKFELFTRGLFEKLFVPLAQRNKQDLDSQDINTGYRQKVRRYTKYLIGRKIPKNTPKYTKQEIQNGMFFVKTPKIMRVIAKWVQQLIKIVNEPQENIRDWFYPFKTHDGKQLSLSFTIRNSIYSVIKERRKMLFMNLQEIRQQCFAIQGFLTRDIYINAGNLLHLSEEQINVGLFSSNLSNALSSYLFLQLNELIHFLLESPLQIRVQDTDIAGFYFQNKAQTELNNVNLISFRIFDLIRCKCVSGEDQIIYLINELKRMDSDPNIDVKFVRVKDRLEEGTRDVLINIKIYSNPVSEMQLSVTSQVQEKQQLLDKYNHFLYQLRRSTMLGPLIQNVSIWTSLEQRALYFNDLTLKKFLNASPIPAVHECGFENLTVYHNPIVCCSCNHFYHIPRTCLNFWHCQICKQQICGECRYLSMTQRERKKLIFGPVFPDSLYQDIFEYTDVENLQKFPGMSFISRKNVLKPQLSFVVKHQPISQEQPNYQLAQVVYWKRIQKIVSRSVITQQNSKKKQSNLKKYIIYGVNPNIISIMTLAEIKKEISQPSVHLINLLYDPSYLSNLTQLHNKKLKDKLFEQIQQILAFKKIDKIIVVKPKKTSILILAQIYIQNSQLRKKLTRRNNFQSLIKAAKSNSTILCLENKKLSIEFDSQKIQYRYGYQIFNRLCQNVVKLYLNYGTITNIESLKAMVNVQSFSISNNKLASLKGVQGMIKLRKIHFDFNEVESLQPLTNLINLQFIVANQNKISSFKGIQYLIKLRQIAIFDNQIENFDNYLNKLSSLQVLYMRKNKLKAIQNIQNLTSLDSIALCLSFINLAQNPIQKIIPFSFAPNLKNYSASQTDLTQIPSAISVLDLTDISLHQNLITRISGLENQKNLKYLGLNNNKISKIEGLSNLKLQTLLLDNNQIKVIEGIANFMDSLKVFSIRKNPIEDCGQLRSSNFQFQIRWTEDNFTPQAKKELEDILGMISGSLSQTLIKKLLF